MSVDQVMRDITPLEQTGWEIHFQRYPPGDYLTQTLLAQLCSIVVKALGGDKVGEVEIYDFAPWLLTENVKEAREKQKVAKRQQMVLGHMRNMIKK